jgi:glycosyltransferase involved in cell wall biosynthesis
MIRILYLITGTSIGGTERVLADICGRLDRRRYLPTVVSLKKEGPVASRLRDQGVEVLSLNMREAADWLSTVECALGLWRLPRMLKGRSFDILHSFLYRANIFGRLAAPRCGIARVVNAVRVTAEEESPLMRRLDAGTIHRADAVCALSESLARELKDRLGLSPEKIAVIPNGLDTEAADRALRESRGESRLRLGLSPADMVVAAIGRLHRQKGHSALLEAFRPFSLDHPRGRLILAGEGPEGPALRAQAERLRIAPHVLFAGPVSSPWPILAAADIFVLSSLYEGMPNVLLEAMAASLPVVATSVGAVPEMITDGREGLMVPPGDPGALADALNRLSWSADLRQEMGRCGRRRVEESFRPDVTVERLDRLYRSLLG